MTRMVRITNCEDPERGPKQIVVSAFSPDMKAQLFAEVVDPGREREIAVGKHQVLVISQEMIREIEPTLDKKPVAKSTRKRAGGGKKATKAKA